MKGLCCPVSQLDPVQHTWFSLKCVINTCWILKTWFKKTVKTVVITVSIDDVELLVFNVE